MATFTPAKAAPPTPVAAVPGAAPVIMSKITGVPVVKDDTEFGALSFEEKMLIWNHYITNHMMTLSKSRFKTEVKSTTTGLGKTIASDWPGFANWAVEIHKAEANATSMGYFDDLYI